MTWADVAAILLAVLGGAGALILTHAVIAHFRTTSRRIDQLIDDADGPRPEPTADDWMDVADVCGVNGAGGDR